jgi:hypothetical protein
MARGKKTGGRKRGVPNRLTAAVIERLAELDCDPIEGMAKIAADENAPIEVRARMYSELAQYIAPKRRAIDHDLSPTAADAMMPRIIEIVAGPIDPTKSARTYRPA